MTATQDLSTEIKQTVRKRDGQIVSFDSGRIKTALTKAFRSHWALSQEQTLNPEQSSLIEDVLQAVLLKLKKDNGLDAQLDVERIQDIVELILMRHGHYEVAKDYILYREKRAHARLLETKKEIKYNIALPDGAQEPYNREKLKKALAEICKGLEQTCSVESLLQEVEAQLFDGITRDQIRTACILAARSLIEKEPSYDSVASRCLLRSMDREVIGEIPEGSSRSSMLKKQFAAYLQQGIAADRLSPKLLEFDTTALSRALVAERDAEFPYQGLQTLYDRYLIHINDRRIELPQYFWMRVAMGLALNERHKEKRAIEFYEVISTFRYVPSTPTLFNSGTNHPQLSSCYLSTVQDDLEDIFRTISDNAKLSKWAGGLGNDWTSVRATHSRIKGTNGRSQGVIPFLKVVNDTAVAVNQGGKRKGAVCCYLETWHLDIEEFLELRKNTGDERRRTHDMHTANWIPDLFMKRVARNEEWTLFSPNDVPDLHDLYGKAFEERYSHYEHLAKEGKISLSRSVRAVDLWRKMLSRLFETGHPWITWKDPSNIRGAQQHAGTIHSSNLCTEILLNTSKEETAVCNLGSINLKAHIHYGELNLDALSKTVQTAIRMLDNVIEINFYPTPQAKVANLRHRPIGLGLMGFQDALYQLGIPYASSAAVKFSDISAEAISYYAIEASMLLAQERGCYESFQGSTWSQGILPLDTIDRLEEERGEKIQIDREARLDWESLRRSVLAHGMRNSHVMAIAPTATISQIIGVAQSIEPNYTNLFTKSNLSGEFVAVNKYLIEALKKENLWDQELLDELKYHDGSLQSIQRIPESIRQLFKTAFEVGSDWLIACAAKRQKWIDMGQSLNLYLMEPSGKKLDEMYRNAWNKGLKTTYYLRTRAATQVEKSTLDINKFGIQPKWMKNKSASDSISLQRAKAPQSCSLENPDCEACQ